jgi:hypothetical protein
MGRIKEANSTLIKATEEAKNFFIKTWWEYYPTNQSIKELAESVQNNFGIQVSENDVVKAFSLEIEVEDKKLQFKHLNLR